MKRVRKFLILAIAGLGFSLALCSEKKEEVSGLYVIRPPRDVGLDPQSIVALKQMIAEHQSQHDCLIRELEAINESEEKTSGGFFGWFTSKKPDSPLSRSIRENIIHLKDIIAKLEGEKEMLYDKLQNKLDVEQLYAQWQLEQEFYNKYSFLNPAIVALNTLNDKLCIQATKFKQITPKNQKTQLEKLTVWMGRSNNWTHNGSRSNLGHLACCAALELYKIRKKLEDKHSFLKAQWRRQNNNYMFGTLPESSIQLSEKQIDRLVRCFHHYETKIINISFEKKTKARSRSYIWISQEYIHCSIALLLKADINPCAETTDSFTFSDDSSTRSVCRICEVEIPEVSSEKTVVH